MRIVRNWVLSRWQVITLIEYLLWGEVVRRIRDPNADPLSTPSTPKRRLRVSLGLATLNLNRDETLSLCKSTAQRFIAEHTYHCLQTTCAYAERDVCLQTVLTIALYCAINCFLGENSTSQVNYCRHIGHIGNAVHI